MKVILILMCASAAVFGGEGFWSHASRQIHESANRRKPLSFRVTMLGDTRSDDGTLLNVKGYEASDGAKLTVISGEFASPAGATEHFEKQLAKSVKSQKKTELTNAVGKVVGHRAQVVFQQPTRSEKLSGVLWTSGKWFYEVTSSSLRDSLELEKHYKEQGQSATEH